MKKKHRKLEKYVNGLEQQMDYLQEHNTMLINENNILKDKYEKNREIYDGVRMGYRGYLWILRERAGQK